MSVLQPTGHIRQFVAKSRKLVTIQPGEASDFSEILVAFTNFASLAAR
jgi:hypothetical protein